MTDDDINRPTQDITEPKLVQIEIRADGQVIWVHVDGITALRVCRPELLVVTDHRPSKDHVCDPRDRVPLFGPSGREGADTTWWCDVCGVQWTGGWTGGWST